MNAALIARIVGLIFLVFGVAGFLPWVAPAAAFDAPVITLDAGYRMLFGIFPVNAALDVLYLLFGIWGLVAGARFRAAVVYSRSLVWIALVLIVLGAIPITNTLFGAAPIYGWDVALYVLVAIVAAYGGYGRGSIMEEVQAPAE
ncbi:MAG TPA: DUF4383 domain-containing protein [Candidatus Baltobacteraceae bacterium]|nr:DUF4383 domain-containing protein [Candidatus Baltobacteraceae bacterium]